MKILNFLVAVTFALSLFVVSHAYGARQFVRSVNDGSAGDDIVITDMNIVLSSNFTVAGWVKHATGNFNNSQHDILLSCWNNSTDDELTILIRGWGEGNRGNLGVLTDNFDVNTGSTRPFQDNTEETHIAFRKSGTSLTFWVNGSSVATVTMSDTATMHNCALGSWGWDYFQGFLWGWTIWDAALSDAQISSLAQRFTPECYRNNLVFAFPAVTLQEIVQGGSVTNNGTDAVAHPRTIFCGE